MRHIPLRGHIPDSAWIDRANSLLDDLKLARDSDDRNKIIDANRDIWGELKPWLLTLSNGKCWFSEAKDGVSHWEVEHYRPKKSARDIDGTSCDGYWWLAFNWQNFRICGNAINRKKGSFFPLRPGSVRVLPLGDVRQEEPLLLDPIDEDDPALISFDSTGRAIPAAYITDPWEKTRVESSIERYNLNFGPLVDKRKVIWAECWNAILEYLADWEIFRIDWGNKTARESFKQAARRIRKLMREDQEFSAVARACVDSVDNRRVRSLLRSN